MGVCAEQIHSLKRIFSSITAVHFGFNVHYETPSEELFRRIDGVFVGLSNAPNICTNIERIITRDRFCKPKVNFGRRRSPDKPKALVWFAVILNSETKVKITHSTSVHLALIKITHF